MLQDLTDACRALLKTPWFTCVVVAMVMRRQFGFPPPLSVASA